MKASGDFTRYMVENLEPGRKAKVEGSYGMLDFRRGGPKQIWIAGGIGVTPFLGWLRDMRDLDRRVDFFYAVRSPEDALFAEEIEHLAEDLPSLSFHLNISAQAGSLTLRRSSRSPAVHSTTPPSTCAVR